MNCFEASTAVYEHLLSKKIDSEPYKKLLEKSSTTPGLVACTDEADSGMTNVNNNDNDASTSTESSISATNDENPVDTGESCGINSFAILQQQLFNRLPLTSGFSPQHIRNFSTLINNLSSIFAKNIASENQLFPNPLAVQMLTSHPRVNLDQVRLFRYLP